MTDRGVALDDDAAAAAYANPEDRVLTDRERGSARRIRRSDGYDVPVTVRLSRAQVVALRALALEQDTTVSRILRAAVDESIADPPDADVVSAMDRVEDAIRSARRVVEAAARHGESRKGRAAAG